MKTYDVIIVGAGPAGLSLASVLSKKNKICVIEQNKIGSTTKSWGSFLDLVERLKLSHCIKNDKINALLFKHFLGAEWTFKDKYCQLDECKLLKEFIKRCDKKNTTFIENYKFNTFTQSKGRIRVKVKNEIFEARLLIDCSGSSSPIIKKLKLIEDYSSYHIIGYTVKNVKVDPTKFIWEVIKTPRYREIMIGGIMPYSDRIAQVHVFPYLKNKTITVASLKKYLKEYFKYYPGLKNAKIISKTEGNIPMGNLKKNNIDNLFFFGDCGLWAPRFCGLGFNQILKDYTSVGKELNKLLKENRLSADVLSQIKQATQDERMEHFLKCFENIVFSLKDSPEELNKFLALINENHPNFGKYLIRNTFNKDVLKESWKRIHKHFSASELLHILPKKDILYLFELGTEIIEDSILGKYKKQLKNI